MAGTRITDLQVEALTGYQRTPLIIREDLRWVAAAFHLAGFKAVTPNGADWQDMLTPEDYRDAKQILSREPEGEYRDD